MMARGAIAVKARRRGEVVDDKIEVPITVEVAQPCTETDREFVDSPGGALFVKSVVAIISKCEVLLREARGLAPGARIGGAAALGKLGREIAVEVIKGEAVGREDVFEAIFVEIRDLHRPSPVRTRQAGEMGDLHEVLGPRVQVDGIAHVLAGFGGVEEPRHGLHRTH